MKRKGIILAGGAGTRLHPVTQSISKQLLPVYDKPMIYYPLSVLMLAGIDEVLIISTPQDIVRFEELLKDGSQWGMRFEYKVQEKPEGLAQALILAEAFLDGAPSALILGDNIYYGNQLVQLLENANSRDTGATIFAYRVQDPERYGIIEFDDTGKVAELWEKPEKPPSHYAVTGLYFYDSKASELAKKVKPSHRGELEITDLNRLYLQQGDLHVETMGRGYAWLDVGTHDSLLQAGQFIAMMEQRQGLKIACPEEIALQKNWVSADEVRKIADTMKNNGYGRYLLQLVEDS